MTAGYTSNWIKEIEASLIGLDETPQFGLPAAFDWQQFKEAAQQLLDRQLLEITHSIKGWMAPQQVFAGLGAQLLPLAITWSALSTPAFFVTDEQNLKQLMRELFESEEAGDFFYDSSYVQGFYYYFAVELLKLIEQQPFSSPLTPRLGTQPDDIRKLIGAESCFVIDVSLAVNGKTFWGRILLSESFRSDWKTYFAHLGPPPLSEEMKEKIMVAISLEVAHTRLGFEEWKHIKKGDFIVLDHCSYDPIEHKGSIILTLQQKPVFRGRLKGGEIKITSYPVYEEVSDAMEEESFDRNLEPEDEEEDLYGDLGEDEDTEFDEEEDLFPDLERKKGPVKEKPASKHSAPTATTFSTEEQEGPTITPEELPIHLTVEVGRIKMSAGALMSLAPGNLLDLHVSPEQGVDLVVNGKKVGRGELIRMGDVLGVRILSL